MNKEEILASPNKIIWTYFQSIRRIVSRVNGIEDEDIQKQEIALSIIMAVVAVETFINVFSDIVVIEKNINSNLLKNPKHPKGKTDLDFKIKNWPQIIFGKKVDTNTESFKDFLALKELRNKLVHFKSKKYTVEVPGVKIEGLINIYPYDSLKPDNAFRSLEIAENVLREFFILNGTPPDKLDGMMHGWTGKIPESYYK